MYKSLNAIVVASTCHCTICIMQEGQLNILRAPMPGVVKSIACEAGDSVEEGTTIVVLEAMKMQNPLFAPMTGKVQHFNSRLALFMTE